MRSTAVAIAVSIALLPSLTAMPSRAAAQEADLGHVSGWATLGSVTPAAGCWVDASVEVKVYANGRLLGTTTRGRFGLPAGQHTITVVSDAHGYRSSQPIRIVSGRSALIAPRPNPSS